MNINQFADLVESMRQAQKIYFKTKNRDVLEKCKKLEKEVDAEILKIQDSKNTLF